ncbi:thiamine-phosphate kinase [Sphingosinicella ginsenosidimutans]|uniref:Thiamine-monophosphate kinase n=1 Tax=Allosphingosinicella ginsenosidimutans TaxID=1176539 RepID=A0A5C6TSS3_9SPHN|nr:thiamine-phosphate kinase [Sphingosinicella ginsenosidimutans]TXC63407.1 thiamine-phosphate kinase [Sphingosinicella ginsenosidimutans]
MIAEAAFIDSLRALAHDPAARGLMDDAAVLDIGGVSLVLTHDMIVEGVHYLAHDPAEEVAWKLLAVNLSDLAAKGARPIGVLLGYALGEAGWDRDFARGLGTALAAFDLPLLGGDTVAMPGGAPRAFGLTAIGRADGPAPSRAGAKAGDDLWVSGTIGDAGAGLALLQTGEAGPQGLIERYRTPRPRLEAGLRLAPLVSAMMDVSDGLLIDAKRMAVASECALTLALDAMPLSEDYLALRGADRDARLDAAAAGDDYELLFAAPPGMAARLLALAEEIGLPLTRIGRFASGAGLTLIDGGEELALPARLGFEHGA